MRRRLWTLGIFLLIVAVGSIGLTGCSRQAQVREEQTSEQPTTLAEMIPESENMVPMPGETVVSAVSPTPAPNTPDAGEQSASSSAAEQSQSPTPEPVVPIEPAADPTETATAAANAQMRPQLRPRQRRLLRHRIPMGQGRLSSTGSERVRPSQGSPNGMAPRPRPLEKPTTYLIPASSFQARCSRSRRRVIVRHQVAARNTRSRKMSGCGR